MAFPRRIGTFLSFLPTLLALGCRTSAFPTGQSAQSFSGAVTKKVGHRYLLYLPKAYTADEARRWPLLLFLHGSGERGDDLAKVKVHGPPKFLDGRDDFPFVVVSPQCPEGERWSSESLMALLDDVTKRLRVDRERICVTGMSMGGRGTWDLAMTDPGRFAAIAPVCGGALPDRACRLKDVPVRAYHGAKDQVVSLVESQTVVDAVRKCGGEADLLVDPEAGHDSWSRAYSDPALWEWLLSKRRAAR
jgi:predicted peptidase